MRIWMITLLLVCACTPNVIGSGIGRLIYKKINGIKEPTREEREQNYCSRCDRESEAKLCQNPNPAQKLLRCPFPRSEKRCLKECYIPYCKCNEKPEDWNYGMCKGYCEGRKNEINDKKNIDSNINVGGNKNINLS